MHGLFFYLTFFVITTVASVFLALYVTNGFDPLTITSLVYFPSPNPFKST